jgi:uncharacterized protein (TIRG00374 family)
MSTSTWSGGQSCAMETERAAPREHALRRPRWLLRVLVAAVLLAVVFGFALPRLADYGAAWDAVVAMTKWEVMAVAGAGAWNLYTYWPVMTVALPGLRTREAMVVNQASTAVANSVPAGSAIALAVTFRMLRAWGFTTQSITNQVVATGVSNTLVKLTMPVLGLAAVAATGELRGGFLRLGVIGLVATALLVIAATIVLRDERTTERAGQTLDRFWARLRGSAQRSKQPVATRWLLEARGELVRLARRSALRLVIVTLISHLSLYVMLMVTLRSVGVSESDVSWSMVLAAFAFVRLLSAIPLTPGGVGVVELGYVGFLSSEAPNHLDGAIAAGVLVFRAVTFVLPVVLGAVAWLLFQTTPSWHRPSDTRGSVDDG